MWARTGRGCLWGSISGVRACLRQSALGCALWEQGQALDSAVLPSSAVLPFASCSASRLQQEGSHPALPAELSPSQRVICCRKGFSTHWCSPSVGAPAGWAMPWDLGPGPSAHSRVRTSPVRHPPFQLQGLQPCSIPPPQLPWIWPNPPHPGPYKPRAAPADFPLSGFCFFLFNSALNQASGCSPPVPRLFCFILGKMRMEEGLEGSGML